ncbi:MAG: T9SS type A sorting domain-containing protein [Bacteroidetes bacterium]|nr:T9SS type A sorting domain-containing protein [Bacteroidota bacterium]
MKKLLLFIALTLSIFECHAQNWECLKPNTKQYFYNSFGYLRAMHIDSVSTQGNITYYFPYHSLRGYYHNPQPLDSLGGSWLGKKVRQYTDGTWLFDNMWGDITIIHAKANVGDSWTIYNDTTNRFYTATVSSKDTMTVMTSLDSIKTITIHAFLNATQDPNDMLDGAKIILSKNHGFVQAIDLYTFPMHEPNQAYQLGFDWWLDNISYTGPTKANIAFTQVSFQNPDTTALYNYNVGDVFEWQGDNTGAPYSRLDSVVDKTVLSPTETKYTIKRRTYQYYPLPSLPVTTSNTVTSYVISGIDAVIDTSKIPEEVGVVKFYYYNPLDSSQCYVSAMYGNGDNYIYHDGNGYFVNTFEPCGKTFRYKTGFGEIYDAECFDPTPYTSDHFDQMTFSYKAGNQNGPCGSFSPITVGISQLNKERNSISISPNPASNSLTITASQKLSAISLSNILGQVMLTNITDNNTENVDVSSLPDGLYILKTRLSDGTIQKTNLAVYH